VLNTPVSGARSSSRGWTESSERSARSSQVRTTTSCRRARNLIARGMADLRRALRARGVDG
jgi:hypothetical protein